MISSWSSAKSVIQNEQDTVALDASDRILQRYIRQSLPCPLESSSPGDKSPVNFLEIPNPSVVPHWIERGGLTTSPRILHLGAVHCDACLARASEVYYRCEKGHYYLCKVCFDRGTSCPRGSTHRIIREVLLQGQLVPNHRLTPRNRRSPILGPALCDSCGAACHVKSYTHYRCLTCRTVGGYDICQQCFNSDIHCFDSTHLLTRTITSKKKNVLPPPPAGTCHSCRGGKYNNPHCMGIGLFDFQFFRTTSLLVVYPVTTTKFASHVTRA